MERVADHFRNVFNSMNTYVSPVKIKANIKDTPNIQPTADLADNASENATTPLQTNNVETVENQTDEKESSAISKVSENK